MISDASGDVKDLPKPWLLSPVLQNYSNRIKKIQKCWTSHLFKVRSLSIRHFDKDACRKTIFDIGLSNSWKSWTWNQLVMVILLSVHILQKRCTVARFTVYYLLRPSRRNPLGHVCSGACLDCFAICGLFKHHLLSTLQALSGEPKLVTWHLPTNPHFCWFPIE